MAFDSLQDLLHMGGHGAYVWPSYVIAIGVVLWNVVAPARRHKEMERRLRLRLNAEGNKL